MHSKRPFDWLGFAVRFFFGAAFGLFLSFGLWIRGTPDEVSGWIVLPAGAAVFGVLAGFFGDEFWQKLGDWLRWFV